VDAYGYSMASNNSIMSYNPAHWTKFFEESATPGIFIPEDIRALAFNKLAFPSLTFLDTDTPEGYQISNSIPILPPMTLPNGPAYNLPNQFFSADNVNQIANAGQNAAFTASVSGIASPGFQWRLNNVPIPDAAGPSLFIKNARPEDAGTYSVRVTGGAAPVTSLGTLAILNVSTLALNVAADGSAGTLTVTGASAETAWTASSDVPWITITSATSGTGSAGVGYSVTANDTPIERIGTFNIAGKTFTVTQAGRRDQ